MKILVYPKESNPYQQLLYSGFPWSEDITYLTDILFNHNFSLLYLPFQVVFYRLCGFRVFHLHFVYTFRLIGFPYSETLPFRALMSVYFVLFIFLIKSLGYKLVWTAHDLIPHGNYFLDNIAMMKFLSNVADAKIVHTNTALKIMNQLHMNTKNCEVIPIGNYIGIYNTSETKKPAISNDKRNNYVNFGFFGKIRHDKGIIDLLQTYNNHSFPNSKLYIVGQCESVIEKLVLNLARKNKQIISNFSFIPNDKVQAYFYKFDVVVIPFKNITTSSSVLLAMSFKKPVIAPLIGDLIDFPKNTGIFYDPNDPNGLVDSMNYALKNKSHLKKMGLNGYNYMLTLKWSDSSLLTLKLFKSLLKE